MEQSTTQSQVSFLVLRHGERADHVASRHHPKNFDNDADPPLTDVGLKQASATGEFLCQNVKDYDEVVVESSPFVRCL